MEIAFCIASGPSLTQEDVDFCKGKGAVYAVNDVYKIAPWSDVFYAADYSWWEVHNSNFLGRKFTVSDKAAQEFGLSLIPGKSTIDWSESPDFIATGGNSGFQAMNLAAIHGAKKIILLGFDYGYKSDTPKHFFGEHPAKINRGSDYREWLDRINKASLKIKIPVLNCSKQSAITCFPKMSLEDALAYHG